MQMHDDLRSDTNTHMKSCERLCMPVTPALCRTETEGSLGLARVKGRYCLARMLWKGIELEDSQFSSAVQTCTSSSLYQQRDISFPVCMCSGHRAPLTHYAWLFMTPLSISTVSHETEIIFQTAVNSIFAQDSSSLYGTKFWLPGLQPPGRLAP